jgi:glyceraldehyde-3-phosphate dehydrogenase (NADP+)
VETGEEIAEKAGIKKVSMELGSNSAVIVMDDAPLGLSVSACCESGFSCQGQNCIHPQRVYVQEGVYDEFEEEMVERTEQLVVGDPLEETTDVGPMIAEEEAARVEEWVIEAEEAGSTVLTGGSRQGAMFQPTIIRDVPSHTRLASGEVFGPVVALESFESLTEAIRKSNETAYGLQAGIFTSSIESAEIAIRDLEFGGVLINDTSDFRVDFMPFGGVKMSGVGREGVRYAIEEMTEIKTVIYRTPPR